MTAAARPRGRSILPRADTLGWIVLAALLVGAALFLYAETRWATLWFDEWQWALDRRGNDAGAFLEPHNGHLSLVPIAIYRLLFEAAGLDIYGPYRAMVIGAHLGVVVLLFMYARRRVGPFLALLAVTLLLFLGPAWQNILWPFQVGWLISLAGGLGALLMLDRGDRAGDATASLLLALSLGCSGLGVPIALGLGVEVLWGRRRWRDAWIVGAPLALYGLWWLTYQDTDLLGAVIDVPGFVADALGAALSALLGLGGETIPRERGTLLQWGRPLAAIAVGLLVWRLVRLGRVPPRVLTLLTIVMAFWILTELSRGAFSTPYEPRYLYVSALFVLLIAVEAGRGVSVSFRAGVVLAAVATAAVVSNIGTLRTGAEYFRDQGRVTRAVLGAVELGPPLLGPDQVVRGIPGYPYVIVPTGSYFALARGVGTPATSPGELAQQPWYARREADRELLRIHTVALERSSADVPLGNRPVVDDVGGGKVASRGACVDFRPAGSAPGSPGQDLHVTIPRAGLLLTTGGGGASVGVRRFGDSFERVGRLEPSDSAKLQIATDRSSQPWHARVVPADRVRLCGLR